MKNKVKVEQHDEQKYIHCLDDLERRIRTCVTRHRKFLLQMTTIQSHTQQAFLSALLKHVKQVDALPSYDAPKNNVELLSKLKTPGGIKLASLDVDAKSVQKTLLALCRHCDVLSFFETVFPGKDIRTLLLSGSEIDRSTLQQLGFVSKTHVTLAHCSAMSQAELQWKFSPLVGCDVKMVATGLLWNETVMALAVTLADTTRNGQPVPIVLNRFVHITVWLADGVSAVTANELPMLCESNAAMRVDIPCPIALHGVLSLWANDDPI